MPEALTSKSLLSHRNFLLLAGGLICIRFFHFAEIIDDPHAWRQCDTANYIWDFFKNGIDLFHPSVCWMGGHKTVILEFPFPEAVVALFWELFGESMFLARLIFLSFFCGAAFYFYKIIKEVYDEHLSRLATLLFLALPLSLHYSRAIHIDFFAMFMSLGMMYYFLKAIDSGRLYYWIISIMFSIFAFLVKVPYAFFLALPILAFTIRKERFIQALKRSPLILIPLGLFYFWQQHVYSINSLAPDWDYILHYRKFDHNSGWYFGSVDQRLSFTSWKILTKRFMFEVFSLAALPFAFVGFLSMIRQKDFFLTGWIVGALIYLLIFFNLNIVHNYYQIPFIPISATLTAIGVVFTSNLLNTRFSIKHHISGIILLGLVVGTSILYAELTYYDTSNQKIYAAVGDIIQENTEEDNLVIITYDGFDCRNPQLLYRARRNGWSIEEKGWEWKIIERLEIEEGATHFAFVGKEISDVEMRMFLRSARKAKIFEVGDDGLKVFLWVLVE